MRDQQAMEERFRGLLEAAPDAMVIVGRNGTIQLVNGQVEKLFGYRRDELLGQPVELLCRSATGASTPSTAPVFQRPARSPDGRRPQPRGLRKNGTEFQRKSASRRCRRRRACS